MPKPKADNSFHVVRHRKEVDGKLVTQTYSIYCNNVPYLKPARGQKLGRREAHWIAGLLNYVPGAGHV